MIGKLTCVHRGTNAGFIDAMAVSVLFALNTHLNPINLSAHRIRVSTVTIIACGAAFTFEIRPTNASTTTLTHAMSVFTTRVTLTVIAHM